MTTTNSHKNTFLVVTVTVSAALLLLAALTACTLADDLPPGGTGSGISPLQVITPTPAHAQLQILGITTAPSITAGIFNVVPLGETFVLITATVQNTGSGPLQPALAEVQLLDAANQAFPRSKEAEFVLRQRRGVTTMPDQPLPPGARVEIVVVFDVTNYTSPVRLQLRFAEGTLTSTPTEVQ